MRSTSVRGSCAIVGVHLCAQLASGIPNVEHAVPPLTRILLGLMVAGYLLQQIMGPWALIYFALWPLGGPEIVMLEGQQISLGFQPWQLLTSSVLHGSLTHLLFNGFAIYMFGGTIERLLGPRPFIVYWLVCVLGAALAQLLTLWITAPGTMLPTIGASGGVFGLLLAFGLMYPHRKLMLLIPPIPMPAWLFVSLYGLIELGLGISGSRTGIAHFAHLGGMFSGLLLLQYWRGRLPWKPKRYLSAEP